MGKKSDVPVRSCIGCRSKLPKENLIRFSASREGRLVPDPLCLRGGRGAYLCPNPDCFKLALKKRGAFSRALRRKVEVPDDPKRLVEEVVSAFRQEEHRATERLKRLREGEGSRLALRLQRINQVIERLRICEE